ncbi:MAG: hypothetical protein ABEN55_16650, partial [Bradymonadaceae bacterium]
IAVAVGNALSAGAGSVGTREIDPHIRISYRQLLEATADLLDKRRLFLGAPVSWKWLSALWIAVTAGLPPRLLHRFLEQVVRLGEHTSELSPPVDDEAVQSMLRTALGLDNRSQALVAADTEETVPVESERRRDPELVRSVQRLPAPPGRDAIWAADEYLRWLEAELGPLLRVEVDENRTCRFYAPVLRTPFLILDFEPDWSHADLQQFRIVGGLLAAENDPGRLEFRLVLQNRALLAAIHDFRPALPWIIYRWTQALVHESVMNRFGRHLAEVEDPPPDDDSSPQDRAQLGRSTS